MLVQYEKIILHLFHTVLDHNTGVLGRLFSYHMDGPHTDTEFQSCGSHHHTEQKFVPSEGGMCFFTVFLFHICPFPDFSL